MSHSQTAAVLLASAVLTFGCAGTKKKPDPTPAQAAPASQPPPPGPATPKSAASGDSSGGQAECNHKADKRLLSVRPRDKGCELAYTKNAQEAVVATAKSGTSHCQNVLGKIVEKLKGAGFTCQ